MRCPGGLTSNRLQWRRLSARGTTQEGFCEVAKRTEPAAAAPTTATGTHARHGGGTFGRGRLLPLALQRLGHEEDDEEDVRDGHQGGEKDDEILAVGLLQDGAQGGRDY